MKRGWKLLLLACAVPRTVAAAPPPASTRFAPVEISTTRLAEGVYQFTIAADGYVEQLNSVAIITESDVVLFDTTTRPSTARALVAKVKGITGKPIRFAVNSHWHPDHWSGNEVIAAAFPGVEIIATEQERDFMLNLAPFIRSYMPKNLAATEKTVADMIASGKDDTGAPLTAAKRKQLDVDLQRVRDMVGEQLALKRVFPTLTYTDQMILRHGGRELRFISVTGDAAGDTALYLPKEKILITGDAVSYPLPYYNSSLSAHARNLRELAALNPAILVPGHGPAFHDTSYMLLEAELFEEVVRQVQAALRGGATSIDDVQAKVNFDAFSDRFAHGDAEIAAQFPTFTQGMVRKTYIELRDSKEIR